MFTLADARLLKFPAWNAPYVFFCFYDDSCKIYCLFVIYRQFFRCCVILIILNFHTVPRLWPSHRSWRKRNRAQVKSLSCMFFSPAVPSDPTPRPSAFIVRSKASRSSTLQQNVFTGHSKIKREHIQTENLIKFK